MQGGHGSNLHFNFVPTLTMDNKHEPAYLLYWIILAKTKLSFKILVIQLATT